MNTGSRLNKKDKVVLSAFLTVLAGKGFSFKNEMTEEEEKKNNKALKTTVSAAKKFLKRFKK